VYIKTFVFVTKSAIKVLVQMSKLLNRKLWSKIISTERLNNETVRIH